MLATSFSSSSPVGRPNSSFTRRNSSISHSRTVTGLRCAANPSCRYASSAALVGKPVSWSAPATLLRFLETDGAVHRSGDVALDRQQNPQMVRAVGVLFGAIQA